MKLRAALALFEGKSRANIADAHGEEDRLVGFRIKDAQADTLSEPLDGLEIILAAARMYLEEHDEPESD